MMNALLDMSPAPMAVTTLYLGDVLAGLGRLVDKSVHMVVTSPPYFGLRDYGTGEWAGGDPDCPHRVRTAQAVAKSQASSTLLSTSRETVGHTKEGYRRVCPRCGAIRVDQQIGLEDSVEEYISRLVAVFRDVWRVLRADGTLWLNIGDSYAGSGKGPHGPNGAVKHERNQGFHSPGQRTYGYKAKDLMMIPARVALALQADGWTLRSEIIWHKVAPMPESVLDRPTSAHEKIYLLTKANRYFYDAEAVREQPADYARKGGSAPYTANGSVTHGIGSNSLHQMASTGANLRNVWSLSPDPFPAAHYATFPRELPRRCILAGTSARGVCPHCGKPWERVVERSPMVIRRSARYVALGEFGRTQSSGTMVTPPTATTTAWRQACRCAAHDPAPAVVLDPFMGSGRTALVANSLGRHAVGCELNPANIDLSRQQIVTGLGLLARVEVVDVREDAA
jgi:DNA modification methylase